MGEHVCNERIIDCPNRGCYKRLQFSQMEAHSRHECRKRMVFCLQGCGMEMFADKRIGHQNKYCPMRYLPCPLGCPKSIRECDRTKHLEHECVRRFDSPSKG